MRQLSLRSPLLTCIVSLSVPLLLSACSGGASDELKTKIQELESENATLKAEIKIMKETYAQAKTQELANAFKAGADPAASSAKGATGSSDNNSNSPASTSSGSEPVAAAAPDPSFSDLDDAPTKDMILELAKLHVFDGTGDKFNPMKPITRAEYIEWLYKSYNALEPASKQLRFAPELAQQFKDTPASHPAYKYVQALANAGYSIGYDDGTFRPEKPLTREEMLGIKVGLDVGKTLPPWRAQMEATWKFSDSKNVDERFTGYVHQDFYVSGPHGSNIQRAFGKIGTFQPKQAVLRYQAAATLWQMGQFGDTQNTNVAAVLKERENKS